MQVDELLAAAGNQVAYYAKDVAARHTPVHVSTLCADVYELLAQHPKWSVVAVLDEDARPVGLINRHAFIETYARQYGRELFGKRSCTAIMQQRMLVVDHALGIDELVRRAIVEGGSAFRDGYVITEHDRYLGVGTADALLTVMSELERQKSREIRASILYASYIQRSYLRGSDEALTSGYADSGIIWQPRDVVGGDAYFFRNVDHIRVGCVFDCTGHGVPGAFMSLIVLSFLEQQNLRDPDLKPSNLLTSLNRYIKRVLRQSRINDDASSDDGLDALIYLLDTRTHELHHASARLLGFVCGPGGRVERLQADKEGVGYRDVPESAQWTDHRVTLREGDKVLITTDGLIDQIGQVKGSSFGKKRLQKWLGDAHQAKSAQALLDKLVGELQRWQGEEIRRDDLTLFCFRSGVQN